MVIKYIYSRIKWIVASFFMATVTAYAAPQEESIVLDPNTGDYTIIYEGLDLEGNPTWQRVTYIPPTKIEPTVKSRFKLANKEVVIYRFATKNGANSKQSLDGFRLLVRSANQISQTIPQGWYGNIVRDLDGKGMRVNWSYDSSETTAGLVPGRTQHGFGFESLDLPGIGIARLNGAAESIGFPDEGPGNDNPIYPEFKKLLQNDFVPQFVAVPKISVPTPFDAAVVLAGVQKHLNQDLITMKLVDPAFAAQLDRLLQTAVQAAKQGNTLGLKSNIQDLRRLLKREHAHVDKEDKDDERDDDDKGRGKAKDKRLIDKLAAKVLDFDLKYVLKRTGQKD